MRKLLALLLLICSPLLWAAYATPGFSSSTWRQVMTVNYTKVPANATNFPVFVSGATFSTATGSVWTIAQSTGADVCFSSDATGANQIACELVPNTFSQASKTCSFWVLVPSLSTSVNTTFYCWYGNAAVSATPAINTYGANNVWNKVTAGNVAYSAVWHLASGNANQPDSTSNGKTLTLTGSLASTSGPVCNCLYGWATSDYLSNSSVTMPSNYTVSAWVYPSANPSSGDYAILSQYTSGNVSMYLNVTSRPATLGASGSAGAYLGSFNGSAWTGVSTGAYPSLNNWSYVVGTYDGSTYKISTNAGTQATQSYAGGVPSSSQTMYVGVFNASGTFYYAWTDALEELRICAVAMTANWITTEYNNQQSPSTFFATPESPTQFAAVHTSAGQGCPFRFVGH